MATTKKDLGEYLLDVKGTDEIKYKRARKSIDGPQKHIRSKKSNLDIVKECANKECICNEIVHEQINILGEYFYMNYFQKIEFFKKKNVIFMGLKNIGNNKLFAKIFI